MKITRQGNYKVGDSILYKVKVSENHSLTLEFTVTQVIEHTNDRYVYNTYEVTLDSISDYGPDYED